MGKLFQELFADIKEANRMFKGRPYCHLPNLLTLLRLLLTPIIFYCLMTEKTQLGALLTVIALLTDAVDGVLAKHIFNAVSELGRKLDTIADKFLTIVLLAVLAFQFPLVISLCLLLELAIGSLNLYAYYRFQKTKTIQAGRIKMIFLSLTIAISLGSYFFEFLEWVTYLLGMITIVLQCQCMIKYYELYRHQKRTVQ